MDWIDVRERKPKSMANKVIVCCKNGYVGLAHYEKFNDVEEWYNMESGHPFYEWGYGYEVTHWAELPPKFTAKG